MKLKKTVLRIVKLGLILATFLGLFGLTPVTNSELVSHADAVTVTQNATETTDRLTDTQYRQATASQLAEMIRKGQVTPQELIRHAFSIIAQDNPALNAVIYTREQAALDEAAKLKDTGQPFFGVPILTKGLGQTIKDGPNTQGLLPLKNVKIKSDSSKVQAFRKAGFIVVGLTNFPELGEINVTTSKLYGAASNPWNTDYNPGGSSGGAAASTADGIVPIAGGNDAGGSIRIPASWTGLVGLKPTQGAIFGDGSGQLTTAVNFAETKSMRDTDSLFDALLNPQVSNQIQAVPASLKKIPIAYSIKSPVGTPVSQDAVNAVEQAVQFLRSQGFTVVRASAPVNGVKLMQTYYLMSTGTGGMANMLIQQATKSNMTFDQVSPMTWALYQAGKKLPTDTQSQVISELQTIQNQMATFHKQYPIYLTPTTATTAPLNSDPAFLLTDVLKLQTIGNLDHESQMQLIYDAWLHGLSKTPFTQLANLSGEPAISLPTYVSTSGLPLGIQFEAGKYQDRYLMALGQLFESHDQFKELMHQAAVPNPSTTPVNNTETGSNDEKDKPTTPSISSSIEDSSNSQLADQSTLSKVPSQKMIIYATEKIFLYKSATFKKSDRLTYFSKQPRTKRPLFEVIGYARSAAGRLRYRVKPLAQKNKNKLGYLTASEKFVKPAYYQIRPKQIRIISRHGLNAYTGKSLKHKVSHYSSGRRLKIKQIVTYHLTTRLVLANGHYITGNKRVVLRVK